jgi:glycosyltransferase involved in cell wall biosynthesis
MKQFRFQETLSNDLTVFLNQQNAAFPAEDLLKIDLHCHDYNSNVPDELIGRILGVPETWLPTENLIKTLQKNEVGAITITNHNNARSCFNLKKEGKDVLVGAEFSCTVPDFNVGIHVLTYGFTEEQEKTLNKLRKNVYQFVQFCCENDIPTIWAHPLYHYSVKGIPTFDFFRKMVLIFERFEVLNGQRDTWQNLLVKSWLESITPEQLEADATEFGINIDLYCKNRYKKSMAGGSDSHMGIFSGQTGTYLYVPNLQERLITSKPSELALEAIKAGNMCPYGTHQNAEKLNVALLDYVCQIAMYKKDPGLFRVLLHKGTFKEKIEALVVSNAFSELSRNKKTMRFVRLFHDCFTGKTPSKSKRLLLPKIYKPIFDEAVRISKSHQLPAEEMTQTMHYALNNISATFNEILFERLNIKIEELITNEKFTNIKLEDVISNLEIPSDFRNLLFPSTDKKSTFSAKEYSGFFKGLPFPFFGSTLLLGANFTSTKVLYNSRPLLNDFAEKIGKYKHPKRMLWLTDTFHDKNGVSSALQDVHKEIKAKNLPIDLLICSSEMESDDHLIVVKPLGEYTLPFYKQQPIRIPNLNEIHQIFQQGEYDRIMCSTEGVMGLVSLYLKNAYKVPTSFFIHTDWIMFARKVLNFDVHNLNRARRFIRAFYRGFDQLYVLNTDQKKWLTSKEMEFSEVQVKLTAHWVGDCFIPKSNERKKLFGFEKQDFTLLFVGRLSEEKGISDIIEVCQSLDDEQIKYKMVFVGEGPAYQKIKETLPKAQIIGWQTKEILASMYSSADILLLPSKFDTFSCVVLEALSCGLPVIAYNTKGPKDIIQSGECGYLVNGKNEMVKAIIQLDESKEQLNTFKINAIERSKSYHKDQIMKQLMNDLSL